MDYIIKKKKALHMDFLSKWYVYQKERFPFISNGIIILAFSFSAISYAIISSQKTAFIPAKSFFAGYGIVFTLFLLLRILDEFKDKEDDKLYRPHLPVPRGLVKLKELKQLGILIVAIQAVIHLLVLPKMIPLYLLVIGYLFLMTKEFFIGDWLRKNHFWYATSHMFIIPLVDIYASGLFWFEGGWSPPMGMVLFFIISYMNGLVLEIGRKLRTPENEAKGVNTYSSILGLRKATWLWLGLINATFLLTCGGIYYIGLSYYYYIGVGIIYLACCLPAFMLFKNPSSKLTKSVEITAGIWTLVMYLSLGGIPMLHYIFS